MNAKHDQISPSKSPNTFIANPLEIVIMACAEQRPGLGSLSQEEHPQAKIATVHAFLDAK
jgi:hypothetical protein